MHIANATGCSSIYGGNLPTSPWTTNQNGQGPSWANSLFEDNAEFGLGYSIATEQHEILAQKLLPTFKDSIPTAVFEALNQKTFSDEKEREDAFIAIQKLKTFLSEKDSTDAKDLLSVADPLIPRSAWIVGGDGWAYDIGSSGVDHVLASGRNVNILVLDTEVYSNTGGGGKLPNQLPKPLQQNLQLLEKELLKKT